MGCVDLVLESSWKIIRPPLMQFYNNGIWVGHNLFDQICAASALKAKSDQGRAPRVSFFKFSPGYR